MTHLKPMEWQAEGPALRLLDQRLLPGEVRWLEIRSRAEAAQAIRTMAVRGAPAIGMAVTGKVDRDKRSVECEGNGVPRVSVLSSTVQEHDLG